LAKSFKVASSTWRGFARQVNVFGSVVNILRILATLFNILQGSTQIFKDALKPLAPGAAKDWPSIVCTTWLACASCDAIANLPALAHVQASC